MTIKITNPRISAALVEELLDEPAYDTIKAFSATYAFLTRVVHFCKDKRYAFIPAKTIKQQFLNYGAKYKPCLDALINHQIIEVDRKYVVGEKTRGYKLTEKGVKLMMRGEAGYLKSLLLNSKLKRQIQKKSSYIKCSGQMYNNAFLEYISDSHYRYKYNQEAVDFVQESAWPDLTKLAALTALADFSQLNFAKLKYNDTDGRVYNEFVGMKSDLRQFFSLGDLKYSYVMDIRSCHPLFLAHYLVYRAKNRGWQTVNPMVFGNHQRTIVENDCYQLRERSERLSFPNITTATISILSSIPSIPSSTVSTNNQQPQYDGGNSDIRGELDRWNTFFNNPNIDPKVILAIELGYLRKSVKDALNTTINGSSKYAKFIKWFKNQFPLLYRVWERTDIATVGNEISANYETVLMQDMGLYSLGQKLGLHLTYEYDGCGIMCREDDTEVLAKIAQLVQHVQERSEQKWGIRPVIIVKTPGSEVVDIHQKVKDKPTELAE